MKTSSLILLALLSAGCTISYSTHQTQPVRWKQALLDNGASPQCLALIKSSTCQQFAEANRQLYHTLDAGNPALMTPAENAFIAAMKAEIVKDLTVLANYPECEVR